MDVRNIIVDVNDERVVANNSGDKLDADIVVVSAGPWSCAAND